MRAAELTPLLSYAPYSSQERVTCTSPGRDSRIGHGDVREGESDAMARNRKLIGPHSLQQVCWVGQLSRRFHLSGDGRESWQHDSLAATQAQSQG